jgi:hypothetical protein
MDKAVMLEALMPQRVACITSLIKVMECLRKRLMIMPPLQQLVALASLLYMVVIAL